MAERDGTAAISVTVTSSPGFASVAYDHADERHQRPSIARVDVVRDVHHGITLDDAYRWMEADGEEFHRWLDWTPCPAGRSC